MLNAPERKTIGPADRPPGREQRYVYGGSSSSLPPGPGPLRKNVRGVRRRVSTFTVLLILFAFGGASVLYVSNLIAMNRLSGEVNRLRKQYDSLDNVNSFLRSEISKKSTWERISTTAVEKLGLRPAQAPPVWFDVDWEKIHELEAKRE
jgi:cell division protein FtsB